MKPKHVIILLIMTMFLVSTACVGSGYGSGNILTSEDQAQNRISSGNFIGEQSQKSNQEKEMFTNEIAGSIENVFADYPSSELTIYENKNKIHVRSTVHFQRSLRIPWGEITEIDGFKDYGNSGQVLITHVPDIGVPHSWIYNCFNDGGYAYFDDLPFSEIIIGGALGYCEFTSENVTQNHIININGCVYDGINASFTNWHEIRDTNYSLIYDVIPNDFNITIANNFTEPGNYTNITIAVSEGEWIIDSSGNSLNIVENVSTETGNVSLFEVGGYNNSNIIIRDDYLNNGGDVVVYDGTNRVTSPDYTFSSYCDITNGLFTVRIADGQNVIYKKLYGETSTTSMCYFGGSTVSSKTINSLSPDRVQITVTLADESTRTIDMTRGQYGATVSKPSYVYLTSVAGTGFLFGNTVEFLRDSRLVTGYTYNVDVAGKNIIWGTRPEASHINFAVLVHADDTVYIDANLQGLPIFDGYPVFIGALPISPKYFEAEAMAGGTGVITGSAYNAYPDSGINVSFLDDQNEYITNTTTYETDGTWTACFRVNDTNTVSDDIRIQIVDETASQTLFNDTYTSSADWNYVLAEFNVPTANHEINITLSKDTANANNITVDYLLSVPTGKIETNALRSLLNITTTENSFEYVPQNFTVSAGSKTNVTGIAFSDTETLSLDTNETITNISIVTESEDYGYNVTTWFTENITLVDEKLTDEYYQLSIRHIPGNDFDDGIVSFTSDSNPILASSYMAYNFTSTNTNAVLTYDSVTREWSIDTGALTSGELDVYNIMAYYNYTEVLDVYAGFGDEHVETYPITGNETTAIGSRYVASSDSELLNVTNGSDLWVASAGIISVVVVLLFGVFAIKRLRWDD